MASGFDRIIDRRGTNSKKWDGCGEVFGRGDLLPMWLADMDFPAPAEVVAAVKERARDGIYGYLQGTDGACAALMAWAEERYGWRMRKEWIVLTPGVVTALVLSVLAWTEPGDGVVIQPPVYPPFFSVVRENGRFILENPLRVDNGRYLMDLDGLEDLLARHSRARMLVLCSPHNPVGRVWSGEELALLGEICLRHGLIIVSDEVHSDLVYHGRRHIATASLAEELQNRTATLMAPSKTFNLAGLATSAAIMPDPGLRRGFLGLQNRLHVGAKNIFGLVAMETAYTRGREWLDELLGYLEGNRDFLCSFIKERVPGIGITRPEGTFLAWLDFRGLGLDAAGLRCFLVEEAGLGLNDGRDFGREGEGFARLNFGCPRSLLAEGLSRLSAAVQNRMRSTRI